MDARKCEMIWATFCAAYGIRLSYNEKKYFYGLECSYYGKEALRGFEIVYNHKYVFPDAGVTPEELLIELSNCTKKFRQKVVRRSGIVRRLICGEMLTIRTDSVMKKQLLDMLDVFF